MRKCLLWGTGVFFRQYFNVIEYYRLKGEVDAIGITSNDIYYKSIMGIPFIKKSDIDVSLIDNVIIMTDGKNAQNIEEEIVSLGIDKRVIVHIKVMLLPGFDFIKYETIKANVPTILSPNCWAGILYNTLGLEFKSPLINMFLKPDDYLKLLKNIEYYMGQTLEFSGTDYDIYQKREYPVARCADIYLYFNHYDSFEEAELCWERRKKRINLKNVLMINFSSNEAIINEFLQIDSERKVCFVPFELEKECVVPLDYKRYASEFRDFDIYNVGAKGYLFDVFELLANHRYIQLSEL